jgi:hypothetical protein
MTIDRLTPALLVFTANSERNSPSLSNDIIICLELLAFSAHVQLQHRQGEELCQFRISPDAESRKFMSREKRRWH